MIQTPASATHHHHVSEAGRGCHLVDHEAKRQLASCSDEDDLVRLQEELVDRYGKLPDAGKALIDTHRLRLLAEPLGVKKIDASGDAIAITFVPEPSFDTARLIALMQRSRTMRLAGPNRLRIDEKTPTLEARLGRLREVLRALR